MPGDLKSALLLETWGKYLPRLDLKSPDNLAVKWRVSAGGGRTALCTLMFVGDGNVASKPDVELKRTSHQLGQPAHQTIKRELQRLEECLSTIQRELVKNREDRLLNAILESSVELPPVPETFLKLARRRARAMNRVFKSANWLTAAQLSELAGFSMKNPGAQPSKWKKDRKIFAVQHNNSSDLFPAYALDPDNDHRPLPVVAKVLRIFGERHDAWDIAFWFNSGNGYLGGKAPKDVLKAKPDLVVKAAENEVLGVQHG